MTIQSSIRILLAAVIIAGVNATASAQTALDVQPGAWRVYSTIYSIGVEWDVAGDGDHDATATVQYSRAGTGVWHATMPLIRMDFVNLNNVHVNAVAGSILFLTPDTEYDLQVSLSDPDGAGAATLQTSIRTRRLPVAPLAGRLFHVVPGTGGGNGSVLAPFAGVAAAEAIAQPGDTFLLHAGNYDGHSFATPGHIGAYIAWKAAGDGEVRLGGIEVAASHLWFEGFTIRDIQYGVLTRNSPTDVVVTRLQLLNNHYGIMLNGAGSNWYIADNTIVGNTPYLTESFAGEGIELNITSGHTVARNTITNVADAISYPHTNVDIFGNDIFDTADDGLELDNGHANVRIWGNRIHNAVHNAISFQPQLGGPWYIVRNQIVGSKEAAFKFRTTDRFVLLHNTIVHWGNAWTSEPPLVERSMMCCNEWDLLRSVSRNNIWISVLGGQIWGFDAHSRDWRSDLDYDAFDWGTATDPFTYGGASYMDLPSFAAASGLEGHGIRISKSTCLSDSFSVSGPSPAPVPPQVVTLTATCEAVDSGVVLPGINESFVGSGPDRGAHEYGTPPAAYGPGPVLIRTPAAPTALSAVAGPLAIDLQWTDNAVNETEFVVERSSGTQPFTVIAGLAPNARNYRDMTAASGVTYVYRVAAYNEFGISAYSNLASATRPRPYGGSPALVPGTIQAEHFDEGGQLVAYYDTTPGNHGVVYRSTDVDLEVTSDAAGGYNVARTRPGEWLTYSVDVASTGIYTLETRAAVVGSGARFHVEVDGIDKTGPIAVSDTAGWQTWKTITTAGIPVTAGPRVVRIVFDAGVATGGAGNYNWFRFVTTTSPPQSTPYGGTPAPLPGTVQAENFDEGGQSVAYYDTTTGNRGLVYRSTDVDLESTTGGGFNVARTAAGEWLKYTVNVSTTGTYKLETRVANVGTGARFHVEVDGVDRTGPIAVPDTGGWQAWQTITTEGIPLTAGTRVIRVVFALGTSTGGVGNFNWFRFVAAAMPVPGIVQAEDFDNGGQSVAYNDASSGNSGGVYRNTDVDIGSTADPLSGGYYVGWTRSGEWLNYTVDVAQTRTYTLNVRVANLGSGATFRVEVDGVDWTGVVPLPNTGGWNVWQTVSLGGLSLSAGQRVIRLIMITHNAENAGSGNYGYLSFE